jgi:hypothetical protein
MIIIRGEQTTFQQLSAFGTTVTYSLSIIGLLAILLKNKKNCAVPLLALANCIILLSASLHTMWSTGNAKPLYIFICLMGIGTIMYYLMSKKKYKTHKGIHEL